MGTINRSLIEEALSEAEKWMELHKAHPNHQPYIQAKTCADCYTWVLSLIKDEDSPDWEKVAASKVREAFLAEGGIDFTNTFNLVTDLWLFLTNHKMPEKATIKREAFFLEVSAMINAVRSVAIRDGAQQR